MAAANRRGIVLALIQQAFILLLAAMVLDGGQLLREVSGAFAVSWAISLVVMLWYRDRPTRWSIAVVKFGFWLAIAVLIVAHVVPAQILGG